ncbi:MAG: hypothetical protein ABFD92_00090 [Planctomycetaceae bacterium]|nr:hypothetical protein [Planctomycetaceae bacterium]
MRILSLPNGTVNRLDRAVWLTCPFDIQLLPLVGGSYRLYRGVGGLSRVNFTSPVASISGRLNATAIAGLGHLPSTRYTYALRPVRQDLLGADLETPDLSCSAEFVTDAAADWVGLRPAAPEALGAAALSGGRIRLRWRYRTPRGTTAPATFAVYASSSESLVGTEASVASATYVSDRDYSAVITCADGLAYFLAVAAVSAGSIASPLSRIVGPVIADAAAPAVPAAILDQVF